MSVWDVVVVGAGNAAFCAALAAREGGASVLMLERAPKEENGGNSRFTAGAIRFAYNDVNDLYAIMPDLTDEEVTNTDFGTYTQDQFFDDMFRVTRYRTDPDLCEALVTKSFLTVRWLRDLGIRFVPIYGRQAFKIDGRFKFWGGLTVEAWGGGQGLIDQQTEIARKRGIEIRYGTRVTSLIHDGHAVKGVRIKEGATIGEVHARNVVLASGGFESNTEWRARYLGAGWELAKTRGTRFNTGDGLRMAIDIGASTAGNWSGCHAVPWELNAPEHGDIRHGRRFFRLNYPYGIMVNQEGKRFVDEGADFTNYTYAKYGRRILEQPGQVAWQVFDSQVYDFIGPEEYRSGGATRTTADTLDELIDKLGRDGVDPAQLRLTIERYNAAVDRSVDFDPSVRDGKRSDGLFPDKSNWATPIEKPPFEAFAVTCGLTFTFGGLKVAPDSGQVLELGGSPIPGLFAAGELVGGLFYLNYPSGSGLTTGAVIGRRAGTAAAAVSSVGAGQ